MNVELGITIGRSVVWVENVTFFHFFFLASVFNVDILSNDARPVALGV